MKGFETGIYIALWSMLCCLHIHIHCVTVDSLFCVKWVISETMVENSSRHGQLCSERASAVAPFTNMV